MASKTAAQWKAEGNEQVKKGDSVKAIHCYTEAIKLDPTNHILHSNRSAAYAKEEKYEEALKDAEETIRLDPSWGKGYSRKGAALEYLRRYPEAEDTYRMGLEKDPDNEPMKKSLEGCQEKRLMDVNPFAAKDAQDRLRKDPKTAAYMKDTRFVAGIRELAQNQKALQKHMQDQRYLIALGVLLGVDLKTVSPDDEDMFVEKPTTAKEPASPPQPMEEETSETRRKKESLEEKDKGNAAYKAKDFTTALVHYDKAIELDPDNIAFLTNKSAVFFEKEEYEQCVELCERAVERGREVNADSKLLAKAYTRMGNAYCKQQNWALAVKCYDKSLAEHHTPDVVSKRTKVNKRLKEEEKMA